MEEKMPSATLMFSTVAEDGEKIPWTVELAEAARVFRAHGFGLVISTSRVSDGRIHQHHGIVKDTDLEDFAAQSVAEVFAFDGDPLFYGPQVPFLDTVEDRIS
jgi:hypothetical protein